MEPGDDGQVGRALRAVPQAGKGFAAVPNPKLKLLDQVREVLRLRHYSKEQSYCDWIRRLRRMRSSAALIIRTIQELLGHNDVSTTMIYTHVLRQGGSGMKSPWTLLTALKGCAKRKRFP